MLKSVPGQVQVGIYDHWQQFNLRTLNSWREQTATPVWPEKFLESELAGRKPLKRS